jgi:hypothetical protein
MMPTSNAALLVECAFVVASIFERAGVSYTIHHGSLLGATRLQGLLPWDIDFDLFVLTDKGRTFDFDRLSSVCSEHGLHIDEIDRGRYFIIRPALTIGGRLVKLFPVIEVDILKPSQNERGEAIYDQSATHRKWDGGELEPLRRYPFHGSWLPGPNNPEPVLVRLSGRRFQICDAELRQGTASALHRSLLEFRQTSGRGNGLGSYRGACERNSKNDCLAVLILLAMVFAKQHLLHHHTNATKKSWRPYRMTLNT